jgi:NCAIR mutase (PurE)-related protein
VRESSGPLPVPRTDRDVFRLLRDVAKRRLTPAAAARRLRWLPFESIGGYARLDHHRELRTRAPETVLCEGKTVAQAETLIRRVLVRSGRVLATRASRDVSAALAARGVPHEWDEVSRTIVAGRTRRGRPRGLVGVLCAGTGDVPVAEEAARTAEFLGVRVQRRYDAGVAGLHRVLAARRLLETADALVVAAGMEGALPSVVAGLTDRPVVAVPTSVGYGASYRGLAALLAMLNACAPGVGVVNIDNGFGAGCLAATIARRSR